MRTAPKNRRNGEGSGHAQSAAGRPSLKVDMRSSGKSWLLLTGCVVFYVIYLLFGALVFSTIERPMEEKLLQELEVLKQEFLNESCASSASLERLLAKALAASRSGVSVLKNGSSPSNWDLASSMFFANTLVTTVGEFHTDNRGGGGTSPWRFYAEPQTHALHLMTRTLEDLGFHVSLGS